MTNKNQFPQSSEKVDKLADVFNLPLWREHRDKLIREREETLNLTKQKDDNQ